MIIRIDPTRDAHPYEQIRNTIAEAVRAGALRPGTRLPSVRQLARDLDLAPATVARAYRELEYERIVRGAGRRGTIVVGQRSAERDITDLAHDFVQEARRRGADREELLRAVGEALEEDR